MLPVFLANGKPMDFLALFLGLSLALASAMVCVCVCVKAGVVVCRVCGRGVGGCV